ncbi:hypothetical protein BO94DRAFT_241775 [Aspergillus sclerotioniger CBS 115572]|uniref:Uncharacterized protein n=1 Tax=Aspergillus sclerotioniger CBS 115572 TaxID=1450535 RepID=A0A317VGU9_9EURO|nr:hypothetical protein BO94DRAFT_241775 [Aspergillus sclerotioniger CBS 115572]PWY73165.1 hypothetical protein BO94DRAFT_241775 [Aspergillus sclerotioniger CBS 115572]
MSFRPCMPAMQSRALLPDSVSHRDCLSRASGDWSRPGDGQLTQPVPVGTHGPSRAPPRLLPHLERLENPALTSSPPLSFKPEARGESGAVKLHSSSIARFTPLSSIDEPVYSRGCVRSCTLACCRCWDDVIRPNHHAPAALSLPTYPRNIVQSRAYFDVEFRYRILSSLARSRLLYLSALSMKTRGRWTHCMLLSAIGNDFGSDASNTFASCLINVVMGGTKLSLSFGMNTLESLLCCDDQLLVGSRTPRHQLSPASKPCEDDIL